MSTTKGTRRRAVRLTPEALRLLQDALVERWKASGEVGKLTREKKSEFLGLSVVTADRVLRGEGVDRPTLTLAFKNLGLSWREDYCAPSTALTPQGADSYPTPTLDEPPTLREAPVRGARLWPVVVGAVLMLGMMLGSNYVGDKPDHFNRLVMLSERAYHRADYATSRVFMRQALEIARKQERVPTLSEALRLAGDLERVYGNLAEARQLYFEAYTLRSSLSKARNMASLLTYLGETETELGMFDDAKAHLTEALERFDSASDQGGVVMVRRALGELAYRQGRYHDAGDQFDLALASVEDDAMRIDLMSLNALVLARHGQFQVARQQLAVSYNYWSTFNHARWLAKTQLRQAEVELLAGNRSDAVRLLTSSKATYSQIGDQAGIAACNKLEIGAGSPLLSSRSNVNSR